MKQAKFALTATAILAVIGGAVAFKARTNVPVLFTKSAPTASCTAQLIGFTTSNVGQTFSYATKSQANCTITAILTKVE